MARLLIVDDESAQMRALCDTLAQEGYVTTGFSSPGEAIAAFSPGQFDLLLSDLMMPETDGITLIDELRTRDPHIGAIIMTGHGTIDTAVRAMQMGAFDYILKPFKLNAILPVLGRALEMQRLRKENASLQEREKQRAAELASAYNDLESFSYSISHDLRAPLRAIEGFAQLLQAELSDGQPEGKRLARVIGEAGRRMDELIVGLLEFCRVGTSEMERDSIDMTALADIAVTEAIASTSGPRPHIEIVDLPACMGDATVMRQVWSNLVSNAVKYSAKSPQPRVSIGGVVENGEAVYWVKDNGAGFDMRYAERLFGVFQRLHRREEFVGTGVGLAIVHRIIGRHGGRIWAEGKLNEGARFYFALPAMAA